MEKVEGILAVHEFHVWQEWTTYILHLKNGRLKLLFGLGMFMGVRGKPIEDTEGRLIFLSNASKIQSIKLRSSLRKWAIELREYVYDTKVLGISTIQGFFLNICDPFFMTILRRYPKRV